VSEVNNSTKAWRGSGGCHDCGESAPTKCGLRMEKRCASSHTRTFGPVSEDMPISTGSTPRAPEDPSRAIGRTGRRCIHACFLEGSARSRCRKTLAYKGSLWGFIHSVRGLQRSARATAYRGFRLPPAEHVRRLYRPLGQCFCRRGIFCRPGNLWHHAYGPHPGRHHPFEACAALGVESCRDRTGERYDLPSVLAKEKGTRFVSVDPRYTNTAALLADQWIPVRPGTDTALLLAMIFVIIDRGLQDQHFIDLYTVGFETFKDYLLGREDGIAKTPAWAEPITGVSASAIEDLAFSMPSANRPHSSRFDPDERHTASSSIGQLPCWPQSPAISASMEGTPPAAKFPRLESPPGQTSDPPPRFLSEPIRWNRTCRHRQAV